MLPIKVLEALGAVPLQYQAGKLLMTVSPVQCCSDEPKAQDRHHLTTGRPVCQCTLSLYMCVCSGHFARCLESQETEYPETQMDAVKMKEKCPVSGQI